MNYCVNSRFCQGATKTEKIDFKRADAKLQPGYYKGLFQKACLKRVVVLHKLYSYLATHI